jgi:hypothetical protein
MGGGAEVRLQKLKKLARVHAIILKNPALSAMSTADATARLEQEFTKRDIDFSRSALTDKACVTSPHTIAASTAVCVPCPLLL